MIDLGLVYEKGLGLKPDHGLSPKELRDQYVEFLRTRYEGDPLQFPEKTEEQKKTKAQWNRMRSRIQEGMARNFNTYKTFYALDQIWDTPFRQISPTLVQSFIATEPNEQEVIKQLEQWGLTEWITQAKDPKTDKPTGPKVFNLPVFFKVIVPLVKAYVTIRWAKIMNDRRLIPFFKFEMRKSTAPMRAKCEAITDRVQIISEQYGYYDVTKQSVLKMLHYGNCFQFPKEAWHSESQWKKADATDVQAGKKDDEGNAVSVGDEIKVTVREGIRYHHPHPTRTYWDLAHGAYTFNYDYGCDFVGYWRIDRYRNIYDSSFWNKDKITYGTGDLIASNRLFFNTVYSACTLTMPVYVPPSPATGASGAAQYGAGSTTNDREVHISNMYYGHEVADKGVLVTEYFERLIPVDNGLGDYDCPVWFRFMIAGDGCTVLFAEPIAYSPVVYYGYDEDANRVNNSSLSLECLPFQDQFSNVLSQIIVTAKQNLANMVLIDTDQVKEDLVKVVENPGSWITNVLNIGRFSSRNAAKGQQRVPDAVHSFKFPQGNTAELINVLQTILEVMERVLVMSSHEVAQAASHEQTREEVRNIAQSTSSRLTFTATPVDIARDAWKRQLYCGLMNYGDDDFYCHMPNDIMLTQDVLTAMGFTFVDKDVVNGDRFRRARTNKKATAVPMWEFAATRDGEDRTSDREVAIAMSAIVRDLLNNPITAQAIGPDQAIDIANQICQLSGLPRDFKLRNATSPEQQQAQAQQILQGVIQQVLPIVHQDMAKELTPLLDKVKQTDEQVQQMAQRNGNGAKESISLNYRDAPPSIRRQMELAAGFNPATEAEVSPNAPEGPPQLHPTQQAINIAKAMATVNPPAPQLHPSEAAANIANAMAAVTPEQAPNPAE